MICLAGAYLLEKMTFGFAAETKVEDLLALLEGYAVKAKVNGEVVAESPLLVLPGFLLDGGVLLFEINRPVKEGDSVTAVLENLTEQSSISPGITIFASVSVLGEI